MPKIKQLPAPIGVDRPGFLTQLKNIKIQIPTVNLRPGDLEAAHSANNTKKLNPKLVATTRSHRPVRLEQLPKQLAEIIPSSVRNRQCGQLNAATRLPPIIERTPQLASSM